MNNNPVKLLFELAGTTADAITELKRNGVLMASQEKEEMRMNTCAECKSFDKTSARCNLCGCFMKIKVRLEASKCPISKW